MQDSERGSAADWERANVEGSNVSAKRRSRRRWSAEEKARIVRESFWPGRRVEDVARRYGLSRKQLSTWRSLARQGKLAVPSAAPTGPMTTSELIQHVAHKQSQLVERDVALAVKVMLEQMAACLASRGRIEIRGFGSFSLRFLSARWSWRASRLLEAVWPSPCDRHGTAKSGIGKVRFRRCRAGASWFRSRPPGCRPRIGHSRGSPAAVAACTDARAHWRAVAARTTSRAPPRAASRTDDRTCG